MSTKVLALSLYGAQAASARYRILQYAPGLEGYGINVSFQPLLEDEYVRVTFAGGRMSRFQIAKYYLARLRILLQQQRYDVAFVNGELLPYLPGGIEAELLRIPYIYDMDDAFFLKYSLDRFRHVSFLLRDKFPAIMRRAAAVTAGSHYLASEARKWNSEVEWLPTVIDCERYSVAPELRNADVFTVGWIGSPSTSVYLSELRDALALMATEGKVRLVVVGGQCDPISGVDLVIEPWQESTEIRLLNTFDVGIMPLTDDPWARGKCALKLLQYMACEVPVIASPVGANLEVIKSPATGLLAESPEEWLAALRLLRDSKDTRSRIGAAGRARVESAYSLKVTLPRLAQTIAKAASKARNRG